MSRAEIEKIIQSDLIGALDLSMFKEADVANIILQRSRVLYDVPKGGAVIRNWVAGNTAPLMAVVADKGLDIVRRGRDPKAMGARCAQCPAGMPTGSKGEAPCAIERVAWVANLTPRGVRACSRRPARRWVRKENEQMRITVWGMKVRSADGGDVDFKVQSLHA